MNDLADSNQISVFELSPTPAGGILILGSENATSLEIFYSEQRKKYSTTILYSCFIQNLKNEIIPAYLSQNTPTAISNLGFFESTSLCDGLLAAQRILNENCQLIDFRVIRSILNKTILVFNYTSEQSDLIKIQNPSRQTISYFEIQK